MKTAATILSLILLWPMAGQADGKPAHWSRIAEATIQQLNDSLSLAAKGEARAAARLVRKAYFEQFENRKLEAAIRQQFGSRHLYEQEQRFGDLRKIHLGRKEGSARILVDELSEMLRRDAAMLDRDGVPPQVFEVAQ